MTLATPPTYGRRPILCVAAPVSCELFDGHGRIPPGRYRVETYYGRTERARSAPAEPVFAEVYLVPMDDAGASYRVSLGVLRRLLAGARASAEARRPAGVDPAPRR